MSSSRFHGAVSWDTGEVTTLDCLDGRLAESREHADARDCTGLTASPGLIDLQLNGGFGYDFTTDPGSIWEVGSRLPEYGVTAFLPTIISSDPENVVAARDILHDGPPDSWRGAVPVGLHCEGPMITGERRGTHPKKFLVPPSLSFLDRWGGLCHIRMVTLAPELPGAEELVRFLVNRGVVVSAGHTDVDYETALKSFDWGISHGTHLFNAMSGFHHRRPGLVGALLSTPAVTAGLIADGLHVHPAAMRVAYQTKGASGIALVTDAMAGMGEGDGTYSLGARTVQVQDGRALNEDGGLAGSVLTMDAAVRTFFSSTGCSKAEALTSASVTPANVLADATRGRLTPGARGDIAFFDDSLQVQLTVVAGQVVYDVHD